MRTLRLPLTGLALLCLSLPAMASTGEQTEPRIFNGTLAENCQWPMSVTMNGSQCSATLVHPEVVISAAHCLADGGAPSEIRFGERLNAAKRTIPVDFCVWNPEYNYPEVGGHDYGACKLAKPVYDVPTAPIVYGCEEGIIRAGTEVALAGFGIIVDGGQHGTKYWGETVLITDVLPDGAVNLGGPPGITACSGDSGGPAFVKYPDESWHVFGIASGAPTCGTGPAIYATMHTHVPWFEEELGIDITPCHDVDGTWNPTPKCQAFPLDPLDSSGDWDDGCPSALSGSSATCGEPFDKDPDPGPPTVAITNPPTGSVYDEVPATIDIEIDADDADGYGVRTVKVVINGMEQEVEDFDAPWGFPQIPFPKGGYTMTAVAEDWAGNTAESEPVYFGVGEEAPEPPPPEDTESDDGGGSTGEESGSDDQSADEGGEPGGCGCATTDGGYGWALLGVLALARRRRGR